MRMDRWLWMLAAALAVGAQVAEPGNRPPPADAAVPTVHDRALRTVEAFVGAGRVRPTDLALLGVLADKLRSAAPACRYVSSKLTEDTRRRLQDGRWQGLEEVLATELDTLLADERLREFESSYKRQMPDGLDAWLARVSPAEALRRRNRVLLEAVLSPVLPCSGPVMMLPQPPAGEDADQSIEYRIGARDLAEVLPGGSSVGTLHMFPTVRASSKRWSAERMLGWVRAWVLERAPLPEWAEGIRFSDPRLRWPEPISEGGGRPAEARDEWVVSWVMVAKGVELPGDGTLYLCGSGAPYGYYSTCEPPTIDLVPAVQADEAYRTARAAAPEVALPPGRLRVVAGAGHQSLQWLFQTADLKTEVHFCAATGRLLMVYRSPNTYLY